VVAVAVGRFQHEQVGALGHIGIAQQRVDVAAHVAGEHDAAHGALVFDFDFDAGRAQDVAGAAEADA
jgi:hypothetical protein